MNGSLPQGKCESPLEVDFWNCLLKSVDRDQCAERQVEIGSYRVDTLFKCDQELVVVELDGKQFHDKAKDHLRDDELLKTVDAVIRIPYAAMHFFPHATFCVLSEWYHRFKLRAVDIFCMPVRELENEMESSIGDNGDFQTEAEWLEWAEPCFELWGVVGGVGWVGSPKAWLKRWNVAPITLRNRSTRLHGLHNRTARDLVMASLP